MRLRLGGGRGYKLRTAGDFWKQERPGNKTPQGLETALLAPSLQADETHFRLPSSRTLTQS
jgi:hypothetical protein